MLAVSIDITRVKNAQREITQLNLSLEEKIAKRTEELKKANEEMSAFSYSVSHDLRSPLRGIIGFSQILEEDYADKLDAEAKRITSVIKTNASKMGQLIDDLLKFSRLGKQEINNVKLDMNPMIQEIIKELLPAYPHGVNIQWETVQLPEVMADISTIRQVWTNLISNAIKYTSYVEQPIINIGSYRQNGSIVFYIKDNGAGFEDEYKDKLFKVFQRLHSAEEFEGTGIGLALVEKIITKHHGSIWAEGKEGQGATFSFSLPA